ncbi:MAG TPA: META domain-containing protein [Pyrinomonadaceae bacterium]|nr:META domain-containing protein [Pyrinomonadaceae bacterium]
MKTLILTFAILLLGNLGALAGPADIDGIQWTLTYANGRDVSSSIAYFEIDRNGSRFTGSTGCNRMFGNVAVRGQKIDFSAIGSTKMMCKLPAGSVSETAFLNALDKADKFARNANVLYVFDRQGRTILRFKRLGKQPPVEEPSGGRQLEEKKWVLESIRDRKTFVPIKGAFINFHAAKGSAGGNSGCNVFGGEYTVNGEKIAITDVVSTMRACVEDDKMTVERDFLDGLRTANRYEISDGRLRFYRGKTLLLTLRGERKS